MTALYACLLRWLDVAEERCAWCGRLMAWRRGIRPRGGMTHGICSGCADTHFGAAA